MTGTRLQWWGHATLTLDLGGVRVLTDPVLTARVAHLGRPLSPAPPARAARADLVLVSHLHADHLHVPSLRLLGPDTRLVGPVGTASVLRRALPALAARVVELRPGGQVTVDGLEVRAVDAAHDGRRFPGSRVLGAALGFVLTGGGRRVWFAGDTGLFDGMAAIGPVDVAVVPVGGWGPTLGPHHLDPQQAAEAVRRVGAAHAVPMHYGTLWPLGLRPLAPGVFARRFRAPGRLFAEALARDVPTARAHVLPVGGTVEV